MTLIGFATYGDRAEMIADTLCYSDYATHLGRTAKVLVLPHLDAAVLTQGDNGFGQEVKHEAAKYVYPDPTFPGLVDTVERWLHKRSRREPDPRESTICLVGWSEDERAFAAYMFAADHGWERVRVDGTWIMPCPFGYRPTDLELGRFRGWEANHPQLAEAEEMWTSRPAIPTPNRVGDWVDLAKKARAERALTGGFARVLVGGDVFHTRLKRGEAITRKIHTFNDTGEEFQRLIAWTHHPDALEVACWCESGDLYGDCCAHALESGGAELRGPGVIWTRDVPRCWDGPHEPGGPNR